ncbi:MAG: TetR/AcrR family transcriptional regulator [Verrucomicrobia subdivision 3 bacterium]|nr:TetR/AcrR family transcriptional regulator [Limisphaerales bacterium]
MKNEKMKTEVRREQIATAALQLIARRGVRGLSIAGIARQVGLVPSAIYRHFDGKDHVLDLVLDQIRQRLLDNVQAETSDSVEALRRLLFRHIKLIRESEAIPMLVFSDQVYSGRPERKARMQRIIQDYLEQVGKVVQRGQKEKALRADLDPAVAAVMFLGLVQPAAILWHLSEGAFDVTKHTEKAWQVFRRAIVRP